MRTTDFNARVIVRMPEKIAELLESTARQFMTSRSEYLRKALMAQFAKDRMPLPINR
jgi:metal-responsive CopG/Arc/MetJ family transcriptional regulator